MAYKQAGIFWVLTSFLYGCGDNIENSFCNAHKDVHQTHALDVSHVDIEYQASGSLTTTVQVPLTAIDLVSLEDTSRVLVVEAEKTCQLVSVNIDKQGQYWQAAYHIDCGQDNRLRKVSIALLDKFPTINEVEANIQTPAAHKHFVLNRQCDSPIFNF